MENEPEVLAADILSEIITDIKASRPTTSTGESTTGFVFCMQVPGFMVSPKDFSRPWSPIGGAPTDGPPATPGATTPPPPANERVQRAQQAAHNTFKMFDEMLMVRDDGRTETYSGGGRSLSFQYKVVLDSMEALPVPDRPAEQQARIDAAHAVLYTGPDETEKTPLLKTYLANQLAWAVARGEFVKEQVRLLKDPSFADMAPMLLEPFRVKAEQAREQFLTQGAEEVEAAQATLLSLGVPLGQGTIASARERFDDWEVTLLGGVGTMPYTFVLPSEWAQIESQDIGWTKIKRESGEYRSHFEQHGSSLATGEWAGGSSSSSGSAGLSVCGFGFGGSYSESETHSSSSFSNTANDGTVMTNDAKDLSIEMEYGLCKIARPWLVTDVFHMPGWFLRGAKKGAISTGNLSDQIGDEDRKIPMIPTHFLVIRNVKIRAGSWGETQNTLNSYWSKNGRSDSSFGSSISGDASIPIFSCLSLTGGYSHSDSEYKGDFRDEAGNECRNDFGSYFENDELVINGAQVVGLLGEIVPLCPAEDDPAIGNG